MPSPRKFPVRDGMKHTLLVLVLLFGLANVVATMIGDVGEFGGEGWNGDEEAGEYEDQACEWYCWMWCS